MPRKKHDTAGQPPKWKSKEELQNYVDEYFEYCKNDNKPYTIAGLAYFCGVSRQTIYNYSYKDEYFDIIKKARDKILMGLEETAIIKGNAGTIFVMKQYGYRDRQEHAIEEVVTPTVINNADEVAEWYKEHGTDEPYHRD